jgi:hypothetical protein
MYALKVSGMTGRDELTLVRCGYRVCRTGRRRTTSVSISRKACSLS